MDERSWLSSECSDHESPRPSSPIGRAVALHDGVPARDDVPHPDRHVLGLDHLPGMGRGDGAARRDLLELVVGQAGEEVQRAQRVRVTRSRVVAVAGQSVACVGVGHASG